SHTRPRSFGAAGSNRKRIRRLSSTDNPVCGAFTMSRQASQNRANRNVLAAVAVLLSIFFPLSGRSAQQPAPAIPSYNGDWWLSIGGWEQYGFISGYEDCYAFEYRGSVPFTKEVQTYIEELTKYFQADASRRKETVSHALDVLRNAAADARAAGAAS